MEPMEPLARRPVPPGFSLDSLPFTDHEVGEKFLENQREIKTLCEPVHPRHPIPHDPQHNVPELSKRWARLRARAYASSPPSPQPLD